MPIQIGNKENIIYDESFIIIICKRYRDCSNHNCLDGSAICNRDFDRVVKQLEKFQNHSLQSPYDYSVHFLKVNASLFDFGLP